MHQLCNDCESQGEEGRALHPDGVDKQKHLGILNESATLAKCFLLQLGWDEQHLSPFIREYASFADVADVLQKIYKLPEAVQGGAQELIQPVEEELDGPIKELTTPLADPFEETNADDRPMPVDKDATMLPVLIRNMAYDASHPVMVCKGLADMMEVWYGILR